MNRTRWTGRVVRLLALTALVATPVMVLTTSGVAGAAEVSDQDALREAFEDDLVSEIVLTGDITIDPSGDEGCDEMRRDSDVSLVIEGQGFTITKDEAACDDDGQEGERIFRQRGNGTITFQNITVTGGTKIGGGGGALKTDGPVVVTNSLFNDNQALWCSQYLASDDPEAEGCDNPYGGAIYAEGSVNVSSSEFSGNHADDSGGAIFTWSNIVVEGSLIADNSAGSGGECWCSGGGFLAAAGSDVSGSAIVGNSAGCEAYCDGEGGGFWTDGPTSVVGSNVAANETGCEFNCYGNGGGFIAAGFGIQSFGAQARDEAGIAAADPGQIIVDNSTVSGNTASCTLAYANGVSATDYFEICGSGGGFYAEDADLLSVNQSTVSANVATCTFDAPELEGDVVLPFYCGAGGGFYSRYVSEVDVNATTLDGNSALSFGGAFATGDGCEKCVEIEVTVVNSTVTQNSSGASGAIDVSGKYELLTLVHDTIVANELTELDLPIPTATEELDPAANVTAGNLVSFGTIVANPIGGVNCEIWDETVSEGYNFSDDETCGFDDSTDNVDSPNDPELEPLGAYGGPTNTMRPEGEIQGTTLVSLSPVVDQIPADDCVLDIDQRGVSRPQTVIADACDIGSVEITAEEITISPDVVVTPLPVPLQPKFTG